ncbi:MAG: heme ABC exporter ATP-binding protein CcmA [Rhizobiales bacterium]|nr:heme ABC exporter ATP-binding protein CcmA [Hyphomicrobiales bacterium]
MRLSAYNLRCVRGDCQVFDNLCFTIEGGQALVVTGPNGAGKSSLLRLIGGLVRIDSGTLTLEGGDPERGIGEQVHYLGHLDPLKPSLTARENLLFWAQFLGGDLLKAAQALEKVGLAGLADLPAGYLSAGQRRRLSIARLLSVPRPIWLLDEPTAPLDTAARDDIAALMQAHLAQGGIIVAATHAPIGLEGAQELRLDAARAIAA